MKELADEALNAAALLIQDRLGVRTGDVAGHFFSDNKAIDNLAAYIQTEIQGLNEEAAEVVDAGHQARKQ